MADIKPLGQIADKWSRVTPQRTQDYEQGVQAPRRDWAQSTAQAEDRYKEGVQKAITRSAFSKGVNAAGTSKWQEKTLAKGPNRFAEGVAASGSDYQEGFAPYHQVIQSTTLPPRFPTGDDRNIQRTIKLNKALRAKKESGT